MAVEIGTLIIKGAFGPSARTERDTGADLDRRLTAMRRRLLDEVEAMLEDHARRSREG